MTPGEFYRRSCETKRAHATEADAQVEVLRMARLEREPFRYYRCDFCGLYHVAHGPARREG